VPEHIVEAGLLTEALFTQLAVSKYADGLPSIPNGFQLMP
jgi:hypothetical protein